MPGKSTLPAGGSSDPGKRAHTGRVRARRRLRTVRETSAGGLVVDHVTDATCGVLIGRTDRRGELEWVLPKGHVEAGETTEQTAVREVREETGLESRVVASLGDIDYWFVADNRRIHKTVHHYVLEVVGGTIGSDDIEVSEVAWVPIDELDRRLRYPSERRLLGRLGDIVHRRTVAGPS